MHKIDGYKSEKGLLIFTIGKQIYQTFLIYDKKTWLIKRFVFVCNKIARRERFYFVPSIYDYLAR